jgi:DNA-binding PadR family transcriptional regulator
MVLILQGVPKVKPHWFHILLSLGNTGTRMHGLAIRDDILSRTDGEIHLWPATLYRSLQKLEELGWILEVSAPAGAEGWAGQPRFFRLTAEGVAQLLEETRRMEAWVAAVRAKRLESA